jgi:hypothetical protein
MIRARSQLNARLIRAVEIGAAGDGETVQFGQ